MHVAAHQDLAQRMAHLLAYSKQADRSSFGGFVATHGRTNEVVPCKCHLQGML
jgi:hypothetical protein